MDIFIWQAFTFPKRIMGALGLSGFREYHGICLSPSRWLHTGWLRFSIDCIGIDQANEIKDIRRNVPPFRLVLLPTNVRAIIELAAGEAERRNLQVGMSISAVVVPFRRQVELNYIENTPTESLRSSKLRISLREDESWSPFRG